MNISQQKQYRHIDDDFAKSIKESKLYQLYLKNQDELFFGIRNGYVNLYYNCASIAKIEPSNHGIKASISPFYINGGKGNAITKNEEEIVSKYIECKNNCDNRSTPEKKAQAKLFINNNKDEGSKWFCTDVEWAKSKEKGYKFGGRFDIIAIEKEKPHRIALIEVKYGSRAIGGKSGIVKHAKDYTEFLENNLFGEFFKKETISIIKGLKDLGVKVPQSLSELAENDIAPEPIFYFIILDNKPQHSRASSPKQTVAGYIFDKNNPKSIKWGCRKTSINNIEEEYGDITRKDNRTLKGTKFCATFLFSTKKLETLDIHDIINDSSYERVEPE